MPRDYLPSYTFTIDPAVMPPTNPRPIVEEIPIRSKNPEVVHFACQNLNKASNLSYVAKSIVAADIVCVQELTPSYVARFHTVGDFNLFSPVDGLAGIIVHESLLAQISHAQYLSKKMDSKSISDIIWTTGEGKRIRIVSVYAPVSPKSSTANLMLNLNKELMQVHEEHDELIVCGDFNHTLDIKRAIRDQFSDEESDARLQSKLLLKCNELIDVGGAVGRNKTMPTVRTKFNARCIDRVYLTKGLYSKMVYYNQNGKELVRIGNHVRLTWGLHKQVQNQELVPRHSFTESDAVFSTLSVQMKRDHRQFYLEKIKLQKEKKTKKRGFYIHTDNPTISDTANASKKQKLTANAPTITMDDQRVTSPGTTDDSYGDKSLVEFFKKFPKFANTTIQGENFAYNQGHWSIAEEGAVVDLVDIFGHDWSTISSIIISRSPNQVRMKYTEDLDPKIDKSPIEKEEGETIIKLAEVHNLNWAKVAEELNVDRTSIRTNGMCSSWWYRNVRHKECFTKENTKKGNFSYNEEKQMLLLISTFGKDFNRIGSALRRTSDQVMRHYSHVMDHNLDNGNLRNEEIKIIERMRTSGNSNRNQWKKMSFVIKEKLGYIRSPQFLRNKMKQHELVRRLPFNTSWSYKEQLLLLDAADQLEKNWVQIAKRFPGRNADQVQKQYEVLQNPKIQSMNTEQKRKALLLSKEFIKSKGKIDYKEIAKEIGGDISRKQVSSYLFYHKNLQENTVSKWTDEESMLLFQLIKDQDANFNAIEQKLAEEQHRTPRKITRDWNAIANNLGTKTVQQCQDKMRLLDSLGKVTPAESLIIKQWLIHEPKIRPIEIAIRLNRNYISVKNCINSYRKKKG